MLKHGARMILLLDKINNFSFCKGTNPFGIWIWTCGLVMLAFQIMYSIQHHSFFLPAVVTPWTNYGLIGILGIREHLQCFFIHKPAPEERYLNSSDHPPRTSKRRRCDIYFQPLGINQIIYGFLGLENICLLPYRIITNSATSMITTK